MDRAFSLPKLSLKPCHFDRREKSCLIIAMVCLFFLIPNSTLAAVTGTLKLADANWQEKTIYRTGDTLYIQVTDADENKDSTAKDTISVLVVSNTETQAETVTLTETDGNTGVFQGSIALNDKGSASADGKLQVTTGDGITVTYQDLSDIWGNSITIVKTASFLSSPVKISTDTTWTLDNSPYIFTVDVIVEEGATLTIEPGVEVKFTAHRDDSKGGVEGSLSELIVYGELKAYGTPAQRIKFSSSADSPAPGDWYGIWVITLGGDYMRSVGPVNIAYCDIKYAQVGIIVWNVLRRSPVSINNCKISDSNAGMRLYAETSESAGAGTPGSISVTNSIISGNNAYGIDISIGRGGSISIERSLIPESVAQKLL